MGGALGNEETVACVALLPSLSFLKLFARGEEDYFERHFFLCSLTSWAVICDLIGRRHLSFQTLKRKKKCIRRDKERGRQKKLGTGCQLFDCFEVRWVAIRGG